MIRKLLLAFAMLGFTLQQTSTTKKNENTYEYEKSTFILRPCPAGRMSA